MKRSSVRKLTFSSEDASWLATAIQAEINYFSSEMTEEEEMDLIDLRNAFQGIANTGKEWTVEYGQRSVRKPSEEEKE